MKKKGIRCLQIIAVLLLVCILVEVTASQKAYAGGGSLMEEEYVIDDINSFIPTIPKSTK